MSPLPPLFFKSFPILLSGMEISWLELLLFTWAKRTSPHVKDGRTMRWKETGSRRLDELESIDQFLDFYVMGK